MLKILILLSLPFSCLSQIHIGYITGIEDRQPLYGITLQRQFNNYFQLESNVFYSQRMRGKNIQADYVSFMLVQKAGYFGKRAGGYTGFGISINPTLDHTNWQNHTYLSIAPCLGCQVNVSRKTLLELKGLYDIGITGGYLNPDRSWYRYKNIIIIGTLKFTIYDK